MAKKIKILISGSAFSWNYGAMAILISAVENLKKTFPGVIFYKGSVVKDLDIERYRPFFSPKDLKIFGFNKGKLPFPLTLPFLLFASIPFLRKADLVLEMPGDISTDLNLFSLLARFLFCRLFNKNFIIYACSLGPYKWKLFEVTAHYLYNHVSLLLVREKSTQDYLQKIGVKNIILTADHAFLLKKSPNKKLDQLANSFGPFIGISANAFYGQNFMGYKNLMVNLVRHINQNLKLNVILIPHVDDDKIISGQIYQQVKNPKTHFLQGDYSPAELKYLIGRAEFFIGSRLHSCISALSSGVPLLVLIPRSSHRGIGLMRFFEMTDLVLNPFEKSKKVNLLLEKNYRERKLLRKKIKKYLSQVEKLASQNALLVKDFLKIK